MKKRNPVGFVKLALFFLLAGALVLLLAYGRGLTENPPENAEPTVVLALNAQTATGQACQENEKREFLCVGEISGKQTYYACINGSWKSESKYNESCVRSGWIASAFSESAPTNASS